MSSFQFRLPWDRPVGAAATRAKRPTHVDVAGRRWPLTIARHVRARRYVLRLSADGSLRLTVPRGASIDCGLQFVRGQADWIQHQQVRRDRAAQSWEPGMTILLRGRPTTVVVVAAEGVCLGSHRWSQCPGRSLQDTVEAGLRVVAVDELPARCAELAASTGDRVSRVTVRAQRSRWGSCSTRGAIALNWRLIQMPPEVSDYIIFHELMHLRQPNHSRAFWREVASVCPGWRDAERWLRRHGRDLLS